MSTPSPTIGRHVGRLASEFAVVFAAVVLALVATGWLAARTDRADGSGGRSIAGDRSSEALAERAVADSVRAFVDALPALLARDGPGAWLDVFEGPPAFLMASDGAVAFANRAAAENFLIDFAPTVAGVELVWEDLRVEALGPDVAMWAASYRERFDLRDGGVSEFAGYVTGVARRHGDGWRLQHLHWSSPPPAAR